MYPLCLRCSDIRRLPSLSAKLYLIGEVGWGGSKGAVVDGGGLVWWVGAGVMEGWKSKEEEGRRWWGKGEREKAK